MSRNNFPTEFLKKVILFQKVLAKHIADGAGSVLNAFLSAEGIVMTDDESAVGNAETADETASTLEKSSELNRAERDRLFDPVFKRHQNSVQFLKALFRSNVHQLGDWGVTVDGENRINYPADFMERTVEVINFLAKHDGYTPPTSPLQPYIDQNGIDTAQDETDTSTAIDKHNAFVGESEEKENQIEQRDNFMNPVEKHLRGIAQYLMNLYSENPQMAGKWGFVIDHSPQASHVRSFTISGGEIKTVGNVVLDSEVINKGNSTLFIRPHGHPEATPFTLNPNQKFKVVRGYGKMDVENPMGYPDGTFDAEQHA